MALPSHPSDRLPVGLCVYGLTYACGLAWAETPRANCRPLTAREVIDRAAEDRLSWVELPPRLLGDTSAPALHALRGYAEERGIRFVVAGGCVPDGDLLTELRIAAELGAPTLRCMLSRVLCGDRRAVEGGWSAYMERCARDLGRVLPEAERLGIAIAVENHQDADSADLLALCQLFESEYLGVTLDTGNPLSVMEEPLEFARRLAPYLRHAHLKDYRIHHAPNGYRLVRCAMGEGVIPFPALFELFDAQAWPITRNIEMAALNARLIPIFEPGWWDHLGGRDARQAMRPLQIVWNHLRPMDEDWRTPFERESPEELAEYEWEQHRKTVEYLRLMFAT
ncbi:MAG: sugar phosphate isomerase/epimerase family protein [Armatimonadota bacterium]